MAQTTLESQQPASDHTPGDAPRPGARAALALLQGINLFNYVDRQVLAAVEPLIREHFKVSQSQLGWLATPFLLSYMVFSPVFGCPPPHPPPTPHPNPHPPHPQKKKTGTGLAHTFILLLLTRCFVGIGE